MDMQNVARLDIPEGEVRTIHDKDGNLIWGGVSYGVKYKGDTYQQTYTGKNLFNKNDIMLNKRIGTNGTNFYNSQGGFVSALIPVNPNTKYVVNYPVTGYLERIFFYTSSNTPISYYESGSTFTTPSNAAYTRICASQTILDTAQFEAGSTATPYEPYVGGVPAPNPDYPQAVQTVTGENVVKISDGQGNEQSYEVNLGKNLFDKDTAPECYFYINGKNLDSFVNTVSTYMSIQPNTTYTITKPILTNNRYAVGTCENVPAVGANVLTESVQDNNAGTLTITSGPQDKYLVIYFKQGYDTTPNATIFAQIQVEKGSTATSYADYFTPIELCKIGTYQDYIYKDGTDWKIHKVVSHGVYGWNVLGIAANNTSSETTASAEGAFQVFFSSIPNSDRPNMRLSENIGTYNSSQTISGNADARAMTDGTFKPRDMSGTVDRIYFRNTAYIGKTGNEVKAILEDKTGGVGLWWFSTAPTDTIITNTALIAQLEAVEQWLTRYGYNATVSGNLPIIIDRTAL